MTGAAWPTVFFCLSTGAALGLLFLLCKALRLAMGAGRLFTAVLDVLYGAFCGAAVFLCALAVDKGRLRFLQAALQVLGAWAAIVALDPLASRLGRGLRFLWQKLSWLLCAPCRWVRQKLPKPRRLKRGAASGKRRARPRQKKRLLPMPGSPRKHTAAKPRKA